jgi:competence protein ComEC
MTWRVVKDCPERTEKTAKIMVETEQPRQKPFRGVYGLFLGLFLTLLLGSGCSRAPVSPGEFSRLYLQSAAEELPGELVIYFLDIGQGDAVYVRAPGGQVMVIDAGDADRPGCVLEFLAEVKKVSRVDVLVLTHPHADHLGDMRAILDELEVGLFCQSGYLHPTPVYESLLERASELVKARELGYLEVRAGMTLDLGPEVEVSILHPAGSLGDEANEASVVIKVVFGSFSVLFTGDIGAPSERAMLDRGADVRACVLKVAHHGSSGSGGAGFLAAVRPNLAVIPVGAGNDYGHPSSEALGRLQVAGAWILRTDQDGTIIVHSNGHEWWALTASGD